MLQYPSVTLQYGLKLWVKSLKVLPKSDILILINSKDKGADVRT